MNIMQIMTKEQLNEELCDRIEENLTIHKGKKECGLIEEELGEDTKNVVQSDLEKLTINMKKSLRDSETLWKTATTEVGMAERKLKVKWFGKTENIKELEDRFYPYIRDQKTQGATVLIYLKVMKQKINKENKKLKVNDLPEPLVLSFTHNHYNFLDTEDSPWCWVSKSSYDMGYSSIQELLKENDEKRTDKFMRATRALILTIRPTEGGNEMRTRRLRF